MPARVAACLLADGARLHPRSLARPVECSDAGRWSSALDATRRQVAAPGAGSAAPFRSGGGIGCAAPIVAAPSSAPWCAPGRQPSRPARAARRLSERRREWRRGAFQNGGANGSAAPFRTAAELAARGHGAAPSSAPGARQDGSHRAQFGQRGAFQNGGGIGCAAPPQNGAAK
ncbi:uncharacterized protein STAUR_7376 [Stigmatella aurantiaca DW4/3-1]|uniref:Uncharacterized protein n=1 Tax=Stigmatella aurantiaca (strain DW4/3-1) TaxID=378806 RepID=E3FEH6_STIAD|nr:uncharacterized protein STAUR_7376 [Stigmatella aurantiaca DW4/3-1]